MLQEPMKAPLESTPNSNLRSLVCTKLPQAAIQAPSSSLETIAINVYSIYEVLRFTKDILSFSPNQSHLFFHKAVHDSKDLGWHIFAYIQQLHRDICPTS